MIDLLWSFAHASISEYRLTMHESVLILVAVRNYGDFCPTTASIIDKRRRTIVQSAQNLQVLLRSNRVGTRFLKL